MIRTVFEKFLNNEALTEDDRQEFLYWADQQELQRATPIAEDAQRFAIEETASMVVGMLESRGLIQQLSDLTRHAGLLQAGEFRVGNENAPGDGFTGGRFGYPGFDYGGTEYFLAGVADDVLQIGLSLTDGKLYAGAGAVVLGATSSTIGGWVIDTDSIKDAAGTVGMSSAVTGSDDIRFWAGHATPADAPFKVFESGLLIAEDAIIVGSITATSGTFGGWELGATTIEGYDPLDDTYGIILDSSVPSIKVGAWAGDHIIIDGSSNQRIRSSNFVTGASGFNISAITGDAEFNNITARGELKTFLFSSSNQMAVAGNIIVSKDAGKLGADVTAIATTVNFGKAMTVGDWIKIQGPDSAGSNALEAMLVGSLVSGTTYNVTRNVDGSGANAWLKDTPFVVIGSNGTSRIELVAGASGSIQLITQGATYGTQTVQASMSTVLGAITAGAGNVVIDSVGVTIENSATSFFRFKDASGNPANIVIAADPNNDLEIVNLARSPNGMISFFIKDTAGTTRRPLQILEDASNANVLMTKLDVPPSGARLVMLPVGGSVAEVQIWAGKDGTETVFNDGSFDVNHRWETATHTHGFYIDAGAEYASFFGDNTDGLVIIDNGTEKRLEIGQDHYFPTHDASNTTGYWNEANEDMDFAFESVNQSQAAYLDSGLDKFTSLSWDGWAKCDETWTRTGNYTFTVSGDVTAKYRKSTKVRYKDGGAYEYGNIFSSVHSAGTTTITLFTNDGYAMAAASLTDTYISYIENPEGFPHWFSFANTVAYSANGSMTYTSVSTTYAKFRVHAKGVEYDVFGTGTTGGTASTQLQATPPCTIGDANTHPASCATRDATAGVAVVGVGVSNGASGFIVARKFDSSNYGLGTGRIMQVSGFYEF